MKVPSKKELRQEIERLKAELAEKESLEFILSPVQNIDQLCDAIAESMRKKEGWHSGNYTMDCGKLSIWIANGENHVHIYSPTEIRLSKRNQKLLWSAYEDFQANPPVSLLYKLWKLLS